MSAAGQRGRTGAIGVRRRWRLTRRGRVVAVVVMTAAVLLLLGPALLDPAAAEAVGATAPPVMVVAAEGDTVWDLALAHLPAGREPTSYVADVLAVNDLERDVLRPGDVLALPQA